MKEQEVQDGGICGTAMVLLIFGNIDSNLPARSRCEHIFLLDYYDFMGLLAPR